MMHVSESERRSVIGSLDIRPEVQNLLTQAADYGPFTAYFSAPDSFYAQGYPNNPGEWPELETFRLVPLWEQSGSIYCCDLNDPSCRCVVFDREFPEEHKILSSIDTAIFEMIELHIWEYGGSEKECTESLEFAQKVLLPSIEELSKLLVYHIDCTQESIDDFKSSLSQKNSP